MALPKRKSNITHSVKLPSGKEVKYRAWKVRDEKDLLFALEGLETKDEQLAKILDLLNDCVIDKDIRDLSAVDILAFAIDVHKRAKGEEIEVYYTCPHCEQKGSDPILINLNKDAKFSSFKTGDVEIGDYVFVFKELSFKASAALAKEYESSLRKYRFFHMVKSLENVTFEGEIFNHFTDKEAETFFDDMEIEEFEELVSTFNAKVADAYVAKETKCLACEGNVRVFVNDLTDFFV